jgi:hypothetical protein
MIQNILAVVVGAAVTFLLLLLFDGTNLVPDQNTGYLIAVIIGGIANLLWPIVIGMWFARRARARREEAIQSEVQRQLADQQRPNQPGR